MRQVDLCDLPGGKAAQGANADARVMTPEQCRSARELLGWSERQLARAASCNYYTVVYFEAGNGRPRASTVSAIRMALEPAGIEFTGEPTPSVRLQRQSG